METEHNYCIIALHLSRPPLCKNLRREKYSESNSHVYTETGRDPGGPPSSVAVQERLDSMQKAERDCSEIEPEFNHDRSSHTRRWQLQFFGVGRHPFVCGFGRSLGACSNLPAFASVAADCRAFAISGHRPPCRCIAANAPETMSS